MTRSAWAIAALCFAAGALTVVVAEQMIQLFPPQQPSAGPKLAAIASPPAQPPKADPAPESFPEARRAIIRILKDPNSAHFGRIFEGRGLVGKATICGEVNAKNGFGGYTGMTPFVYFPDDDRAELITNPATLQMTKEGISAYFKDCRRS